MNQTTKKLLLFIKATALLAFVAAIFTTANAADTVVNINSSGYSPATIYIKPSDTVTWFNNDVDDHTVSSTTGAWAPIIIYSGDSAAMTFPNVGTYNYQCDLSGFTGTVVVSSANTAPTVTITEPAANTNFIAPATFTISADAQDIDGTIANVRFLLGSKALGTNTAPPYSVVASNVTAGSYTVYAIATDDGGAKKTNSIRVTVHSLPFVSIYSPAANSVITPSTFTVGASASETGGSISNVQFFVGGVSQGIQSFLPYTHSVTVPSSGTWAISAVATDIYGYKATNTINVVATAFPTVSVTSPANGAVLDWPTNVNLSVAASDADGTVTNLALTVGSTFLGNFTSSSYSTVLSNLAAAQYSVTAIATDNVGAKTTNISSFVLNVAPNVSIRTPADKAVLVAATPVTINVNADDSTLSVANVRLLFDQTTLTNFTTAPYVYTLSNAPPGLRTLTAIATDTFGKKATNAITITLQAPPNMATSLTATSTPTRIFLNWVDNSTNEDNYIVEYSLTPDGPYYTYYTFYISSNSTAYVMESVAESTNYYVHVRSVNIAGATSTPDILVTTPAPQHLTRIPPFVGAGIETFEELSSANVSGLRNVQIPIFNGTASIWGSNEYIWQNGTFGLGAYTAKAYDGVQGYGTGYAYSTSHIQFQRPVRSFGGFWGAANSPFAMGFSFYDANGNLIDSSGVFYHAPNFDGTLEWYGWTCDVPVSRIDYSGSWVVEDSLRYSAAPQLFAPAIAAPNRLAFQLFADPGTYSLEMSSDLVAWTSITNIIITNGPANCSDIVGASKRFYRARLLP